MVCIIPTYLRSHTVLQQIGINTLKLPLSKGTSDPRRALALSSHESLPAKPLYMAMGDALGLGLCSALWEAVAASLLLPPPPLSGMRIFFLLLFLLDTPEVRLARYGLFRGSESFVV